MAHPALRLGSCGWARVWLVLALLASSAQALKLKFRYEVREEVSRRKRLAACQHCACTKASQLLR
jgi:hypothetical protein